MALPFRWIKLCLLLACFKIRVRCEVFTALIEMESLVYREKEMIAGLKDYVRQEQARLEKIKQFTEKLDSLHAVIPEGKVENYLGHPSNAYLLIKRFVKEWPAIEDLAKNPWTVGTEVFYEIIHVYHRFNLQVSIRLRFMRLDDKFRYFSCESVDVTKCTLTSVAFLTS
jgi:hypothetical protein